jgi:hypothetical protein
MKSSVVIPMHWFSGFALDRFLSEISESFAVRYENGSSLEVSLRNLPPRPTVVVLKPAWLRDPE